jgi:hypothetical protein
MTAKPRDHDRSGWPVLVLEAANRLISSRNRSNSAYRSERLPAGLLESLLIGSLALASPRLFIRA